MAQNKFNLPEGTISPDRVFDGAPKPLKECKYLREKATGAIHMWNPEFGARSDLVEPYDGPFPPVVEMPEGVRTEAQSTDTPPAPPPVL